MSPTPPASPSVPASADVRVFAERLRAYVALLATAAETAPSVFVERLAGALAALYAAGIGLPAVEPVPDPPEFVVKPPTAALRVALGAWDAYHAVFDPSSGMDAQGDVPLAEARSLSADLLEVFSALAPALAAFEAGHGAAAHWEWRFEMRGHAGAHVTAALHALHALIRFHAFEESAPDEA